MAHITHQQVAWGLGRGRVSRAHSSRPVWRERERATETSGVSRPATSTESMSTSSAASPGRLRASLPPLPPLFPRIQAPCESVPEIRYISSPRHSREIAGAGKSMVPWDDEQRGKKCRLQVSPAEPPAPAWPGTLGERINHGCTALLGCAYAWDLIIRLCISYKH